MIAITSSSCTFAADGSRCHIPWIDSIHLFRDWTRFVPSVNQLRYYATGGDGCMMFIQYDESGVVDIESIVAYGASAEPDSPYYNNQMELFAAKKAKKMTLDRSQVLDQASKVYHPQ